MLTAPDFRNIRDHAPGAMLNVTMAVSLVALGTAVLGAITSDAAHSIVAQLAELPRHPNWLVNVLCFAITAHAFVLTREWMVSRYVREPVNGVRWRAHVPVAFGVGVILVFGALGFLLAI